MELFPYQKKAINFALAFKRTYHMIDLGLGKTAIAIHVMDYVKKPTLVFCPVKVGFNTWTEELKLWAPHLTYTIFHGPNKDKKLKWDTDIYILPYSSIKWFYRACNAGKFKLRKFTIVFDESTYVKSWSTKRWEMVRKMMPIYGDYRMCLSGTPAPNGLINLWTQYFALDKGKTLGPYPTKYRDRFFIYTGEPRYQTYIKPGSQSQIYQLIKPITIRLDRKDYLKLPPIRYNQIKLPVPLPLHKLYREYKKEQMLEFTDGMTSVAFTKAALSNKLRQLAQGSLYLERVDGDDWSKPKKVRHIHKLKAEALKEVVDGLNGAPVLVPVQFKFDYDNICSVFKTTLPIIRGGTSEKNASQIIRAWNAGSIPVLLCHPQSISHGLNLQHGGHNIIWYALPWSLDHFHQLNGRLDRTGQTRGVIVNVLMLDLPIETRIFRVLRDKNSTQRDLLDAIRES